MITLEEDDEILPDGVYSVVLFEILHENEPLKEGLSFSIFMVRIIRSKFDGLELHFYINNSIKTDDREEILENISICRGLPYPCVFPYNDLIGAIFYLEIENGEIKKIKSKI